MSKITLNDLSHSYLDKQNSDVDWALRNINIEWQDGGVIVGNNQCASNVLKLGNRACN